MSGLISAVTEVSRLNRQKCPCRQSHSFDAPVQRNPREYPHTRYLSETRVIDVHFCRW